MAPVAKYALVPLFVGFSLFGLYATLGVLTKTGAGLVTRDLASAPAPAVLRGAPEPFRTTYTGVGPVDRHLSVLVGFFAALLDDPGAGWDTSAFFLWTLGQAGAAWTLLLLESLRAGHRGRLVSFAGTAGFLFQNLTYAFVVPLYLALHLLTSPAARLRPGDGDAARRALFVYLWDLAVLTSNVAVAFLAPSLLMTLPAAFGHSAAQHYGWLAAWQLFPVWSAVLQWAAHRAGYFLLGSMVPRDDAGRATTPGVAFAVAVSGVYEFALTLAVATHLPVLAVAALPAPLRAALAPALPAALAPVLEQVTFARTFVPWPLPAGPPAVSRDAYGPGDLAAVMLNFLQYDLYSGSVPFLLWAVYLHQTTVKDATFLGMLRKVAFWLVLGGPLAVVAALLWERDEVVKEGETPLEAKTK
ncbi:hypothetical protein SLS62_011240 [Diatrype stigma]|uniref:Uncharacterized protein n=1 Tax=Diatrype stigma TaxID=117547 RepID=A0AAN9U438_9PEZI